MRKKSSYLGNNVSESFWAKIKKKAHDVWDMGTEGERVLALRKKQDTAKVSTEETTPDDGASLADGDFVMLFMGGRKIEAHVLGVNGDKVNLLLDNEMLNDIPQSWCKKSQEKPIRDPICCCQCGCRKFADGPMGKCVQCDQLWGMGPPGRGGHR